MRSHCKASFVTVPAFLAAFAALGCAQRHAAPDNADNAGATAPVGSASASSEPASPPPANPRQPRGAGEACGGIAGFQCATGLYCAFPPQAQCGAADQMGACAAIPEMCTEQYAPVCGCDDKTYPNACAAARVSVSVVKEGECAGGNAEAGTIAEGQLCGTRGVRGDCAPGLYCAYKRQCGADDSGGVCSKKTNMCTRIYAPVCGCDGKTHGNACTAAGAGVSVASKGECPKSP